jgi:hypothetical protein
VLRTSDFARQPFAKGWTKTALSVFCFFLEAEDTYKSFFASFSPCFLAKQVERHIITKRKKGH